MHTSSYNSVKFHHDGDVDGCMYLVDSHGVEIVTTLQTLVGTIGAQLDGEFVAITGPNADVHDRFEVTAPTYREITPGPWVCQTVRVSRSDLEAFLVYARTQALEQAVSELDMSAVPYAVAIERLDTAIAAIAGLRPKMGSPT